MELILFVGVEQSSSLPLNTAHHFAAAVAVPAIPICFQRMSCGITMQFLFLASAGGGSSGSTKACLLFLHQVEVESRSPPEMEKMHQHHCCNANWDLSFRPMDPVVRHELRGGVNRCVVGKSYRFGVV